MKAFENMERKAERRKSTTSKKKSEIDSTVKCESNLKDENAVDVDGESPVVESSDPPQPEPATDDVTAVPPKDVVNVTPTTFRKRRKSQAGKRRTTRANTHSEAVSTTDDSTGCNVTTSMSPKSRSTPSTPVVSHTDLSPPLSAQPQPASTKEESQVKIKTKRHLMNEWLSERNHRCEPLEVTVDDKLFVTCLPSPRTHIDYLRRSSTDARKTNGNSQTLVVDTSVGSAKKRWLRQAMRDSSDDDPSATGSVSSYPSHDSPISPNNTEFVTPLKKRRLAREPVDLSATPSPSPLQTNETNLVKADTNEQIKQNICPADNIQSGSVDSSSIAKSSTSNGSVTSSNLLQSADLHFSFRLNAGEPTPTQCVNSSLDGDINADSSRLSTSDEMLYKIKTETALQDQAVHSSSVLSDDKLRNTASSSEPRDLTVVETLTNAKDLSSSCNCGMLFCKHYRNFAELSNATVSDTTDSSVDTTVTDTRRARSSSCGAGSAATTPSKLAPDSGHLRVDSTVSESSHAVYPHSLTNRNEEPDSVSACLADTAQRTVTQSSTDAGFSSLKSEMAEESPFWRLPMSFSDEVITDDIHSAGDGLHVGNQRMCVSSTNVLDTREFTSSSNKNSPSHEPTKKKVSLLEYRKRLKDKGQESPLILRSKSMDFPTSAVQFSAISSPEVITAILQSGDSTAMPSLAPLPLFDDNRASARTDVNDDVGNHGDAPRKRDDKPPPSAADSSLNSEVLSSRTPKAVAPPPTAKLNTTPVVASYPMPPIDSHNNTRSVGSFSNSPQKSQSLHSFTKYDDDTSASKCNPRRTPPPPPPPRPPSNSRPMSHRDTRDYSKHATNTGNSSEYVRYTKHLTTARSDRAHRHSASERRASDSVRTKSSHGSVRKLFHHRQESMRASSQHKHPKTHRSPTVCSSRSLSVSKPQHNHLNSYKDIKHPSSHCTDYARTNGETSHDRVTSSFWQHHTDPSSATTTNLSTQHNTSLSYK